jgi:anti-sigma-K factor RskA
MSNETDRMARAGNYVLGLMSEAERERAERDLERDQSFRDDVLRIAERMRLIGSPQVPDMKWQAISARIAELPQMRGIMPSVEPAPPTGAGKESVAQWRRLHSVPTPRAAIMAACLIAAFAVGYIVGVSSPGLFSGAPVTDTAEQSPDP